MIAHSELILNPDGSIYHLGLKPGELAEKIILVGDPFRVPKVAAHFDSIALDKQKREFRTISGDMNGQRISVMSTGMGSDNIDIALTEIDALFNIDFKLRKVKENLTAVQMLRIGTCGGLQASLPDGAFVFSAKAIAAEGLFAHYQLDESIYTNPELDRFTAQNDATGQFYITQADPKFTELAQNHPDFHCGITYTACGFYGPQGRSVSRMQPKDHSILDKLHDLSIDREKVLNLEMETAAILGMSSLLGHQSASLSAVLANRARGTFVENSAELVEQLIQKGIEMLLAI